MWLIFEGVQVAMCKFGYSVAALWEGSGCHVQVWVQCMRAYLLVGSRTCSPLCEASPRTGGRNVGSWPLSRLEEKARTVSARSPNGSQVHSPSKRFADVERISRKSAKDSAFPSTSVMP